MLSIMSAEGSAPESCDSLPTPEELWPAYYEELHAVASAVLRGEPVSPSLQPTLVLHEAYMKVFRDGMPQWHGKAYFVASIARAMRQYLVDRSRKRRVEKRSLELSVIRDVAELSLARVGRTPEMAEAISVAIDELAKRTPRAAAIVEMRVAYEFSNEQLAELLDISPRTVKADLKFARAWIFARLGGVSLTA